MAVSVDIRGGKMRWYVKLGWVLVIEFFIMLILTAFRVSDFIVGYYVGVVIGLYVYPIYKSISDKEQGVR